MRMKELVEATGLPRTAIHHYQREGLLPPAKKTATNSATYGPEHVDRLRLIQALRGSELGPLPIERIRAIVRMVNDGVEPEVATAVQSLPATLRPGREKGDRKSRLSLSDVARAVGLSRSTARELADAGLLVGSGAGGEGRTYDAADVTAARILAAFLGTTEIRVADLEPIAELAAETERYERALVSLATARMPAEEAAERRQGMFRSLHALHTYLHIRMMQGDGDGVD